MPDKSLSPAEIARNRAALTHIKAWLHYRAVSQRRLSEALGMSEPAISKWIAGRQSMTVAQFMQVATILNAEPSDLLFPPPSEGRGGRYKKAAEIAKDLPDDQLENWLAVGLAMAGKRGAG